MKTIGIVIVVLLMVFGLGYLGGYGKARDKFEARLSTPVPAAEIKRIVEQEAVIADLMTQIKTEAKDRQVDIIKTQVVEKIVKSPPQKCEVSQDATQDSVPVITISPYHFDPDVVRLLNSARADGADPPVFEHDAAGTETANVGVEELVENDLEVVKLYHGLAERHRSLQDYVKRYQDEGYQFCKLATR